MIENAIAAVAGAVKSGIDYRMILFQALPKERQAAVAEEFFAQEKRVQEFWEGVFGRLPNR